ncbi:hypothetical protein [Nocardiopsis sp. CNR-923]|uniref:hypothetical protein n=1 Tax=Nocardiopsis sp. CNR-923 TaxID=1904965 RepID=UPI0021CCDFCF
MRQNDFPAAPMILGLILGGLMEKSMRQALQISGGEWSVFLTEPISAALIALAVLSMAPSLVRAVRGRLARRSAVRAADGDADHAESLKN